MTTTHLVFRIQPFPAAVLDSVRTTGLDEFGTPAERIVSEGGQPLRCCLRDSSPGDDLLLFGFRPALPVSPYREVGAVLVHAEPCTGPAETTTYPDDWRGRPQILRAYDDRGWIHDATTRHDGRHPERAIADVLAQPGVVQVHSRNIEWGCYMFTATRAY